MALTMVPDGSVLAHTLPTEQLRADGRPKPPLRDELRRIDGTRNALTVASAWGQTIAVIWGAIWLHHPLVWIAAFLLMGRANALGNILAHEAAHRLLFRRKRVNDVVGRWLLGYPFWVVTDLYRRGHMAHHRDELGPEEPDTNLYAHYPITRASMRRKLTRDAVGISGFKPLRGLVRGLKARATRPYALKVLTAQAVILGAFAAIGRPELYLFLWFGPRMTVWQVLNRLRAIAEHGGMERSDDGRRTTHHVRQGLLARFWMVPYNTGWHLAHHVDISVPWRNLPRFHDELVAAGYVTPGLTYPSYVALWRKLASRPR
jgi:fatty acid desaturase